MLTRYRKHILNAIIRPLHVSNRQKLGIGSAGAMFRIKAYEMYFLWVLQLVPINASLELLFVSSSTYDIPLFLFCHTANPTKFAYANYWVFINNC